MAFKKKWLWGLLWVAAMLVPICLSLYQGERNDPQARRRFLKLREDAKTITVGMPFEQVTDLLGVPDAEAKWLDHLPNQRVYYFDADRRHRLGSKPRAYISVLIDSESGVRTVDVYDPVFETCHGNKIDGTCTPINRKHRDRFAGPHIIGA